MTKGLTDDEAAQLLRVNPRLVYLARHGEAAGGPGASIGMAILSDGLWHPMDDAVRELAAGRYDRAQVEAKIGRMAYEADRPIHEAVRAADAQREANLAKQRAENIAKAKERTDRQAAADKRYEDAMVAAGLGGRQA